MATFTPTVNRTVLHAANALSGNGASVPVKDKTIVVLSGESAGTAGVLTFEHSVGTDGLTWTPITAVRASDGATISSTAAAEDGNVYVLNVPDGQGQVRARISTPFVTASPLVTAIGIS